MRMKIYLLVILLLLLGEPLLPQDAVPRVSPPQTEIRENVVGKNFPLNDSFDEELEVFSRSSFEKETFNYFRIDKSGKSLWNGKHWSPADYPLKIYVKNPASKYFKNLFKSYVDYALGVWEQADDRIKFKYVSGEKDADIVVVFEENLITKYDDNYLGITDYDLTSGKKIKKSIVEIGLLKFNNEVVSDGEVKATIIHEIGHALGLGHSESESDIMFPFINPFSSSEMNYDELSSGDVLAVRSVVNLGYNIIWN